MYYLSKLVNILLILLFPSFVWAAQPAPAKDVIVTGKVSFPAGTTTTPSFKVPDLNTGRYKLSIPCDPKMNFTLLIETTEGRLLGKFTRVPGVCDGPNIHATFFLPAPITKGTMLQVKFTTATPINTEITVEIDKSA